MRSSQVIESASALQRDGYVVLKGLYSRVQVEKSRRQVLNRLALFKNTRPNPSAGHLAGFHRYPELESLHLWISSKPGILRVLRRASGCEAIRSIGLSDITVNRSQAWHVDLLRGRYQHHLDPQMCWGADGGGVYKALVYLQPGRSLKVVPGAHLAPLPLDKDQACEPVADTRVQSLSLEAGDVILMDLRLPHCGSTEAELAGSAYATHPKILVSTVLGAVGKPLTQAMEIGNFERLHDWERTHQ